MKKKTTNPHLEMGKNLNVYLMNEDIQMKVFNGFIRHQENTNELSWVLTLPVVSIKSLCVHS